MSPFYPCQGFRSQTEQSVELFAAAQGIDFRRQMLGPEASLGHGTAPAYDLIRQYVPFLARDAMMYPHIEAIRKVIASGELVTRVRTSLEERKTAST